MTDNRATNLQNRVTGNKRVMVLAMLLVLGISGKSYAGWPFNRTPAIEGRITDATTGAPIENVIVACGWQKSVPSFGGDITRSFAGEVFVTGKDGKYKIPAKVSFHLYSSFGGMMVQILHPLYETKMGYGGSDGVGVDGHGPEYKSPDGIVHADIRLMGVRERYLQEVTSHKSQVTSEEEKERIRQLGFAFESFVNTHTNGWYWLTLNGKNIPYDLDAVLSVWNNIAEELGRKNSLYYPKYIIELKKNIQGRDVK